MAKRKAIKFSDIIIKPEAFEPANKKPKMAYSYSNTPPKTNLEDQHSAGIYTVDTGFLSICVIGNHGLAFDCGQSPQMSVEKVVKSGGNVSVINPKVKSSSRKFETIPPKTRQQRSIPTINFDELDVDKQALFLDYRNCNIKSNILETVETVTVIISHEDIDHSNNVEQIFREKTIKAFILGGNPSSYAKNDSFLKFIMSKCQLENSKTEVYFTILNQNVSHFFAYNLDTAKSRLKELNISEGIKCDANFIPFVPIIRSNSPYDFAKYLIEGKVKAELLNVNCGANITNNIYSSQTSTNSHCLMMRVYIGCESLIFTADTSASAQVAVSKTLETNNLFPFKSTIASTSHGSQSLLQNALNVSNTPESLRLYKPFVWLACTSVSQYSPTPAFLLALKDTLDPEYEPMSKHEVICFVHKDVIDDAVKDLKSSFDIKYKVEIPRNQGHTYFSHYCLFLHTTLPIITLQKPVTISFGIQHCSFYQTYTNLEEKSEPSKTVQAYKKVKVTDNQRTTRRRMGRK